MSIKSGEVQFKTGIKEHLILGDHILNLFNKLLNIKIDELYGMHSSDIEDINESMRYYCTLLSKYLTNKHKTHTGSGEKNCCSCYVPGCKNVKKKQEQIKLKDGCLFENKMALRLTNDSQIYKHLKENKRDEIDAVKAVANYFMIKFGDIEGCKKFQELVSSMERGNGRNNRS